MKIFTVTSLVLVVMITSSGCGKKSGDINSLSGSVSSDPDCSGYTSQMVIPYGFTGTVSSTMGGKVFAKLTAVDSVDGTMKITITPVNGSFPTDFIEEFSDYKLRFIACREDISSVSSGSSTTGVCSRSGSVNIIGNGVIEASHFQNSGLTVNNTIVHATRNPDYDTAMNYFLKPDFIMLTASLFDEDQLGQFMIAFGRSPYYTGCYKK